MNDNLLCPHCGGAIQNDPQLAGQRVTCPHCSGPFTAPRLAPPAPESPTPMPLREPPTSAPPPQSSGIPQFITEAGATPAGRRRTNQHPDWNALLIVGGIVGGGILVVLIVGVGFYVAGPSSSDSGGGLTSMLPESANLPIATDPKFAADREQAESSFARKHAGQQLQNVRWSSKPLYLAIMTSKDLSGLTSTEVVSEQRAAEYLRERNAERRDLNPLEIYKMERIGTVFTVEYEGLLFGSEKAATETIEVKYDGYKLMIRPNENGDNEPYFDRSQSRSVQSVGTVIKQL